MSKINTPSGESFDKIDFGSRCAGYCCKSVKNKVCGRLDPYCNNLFKAKSGHSKGFVHFYNNELRKLQSRIVLEQIEKSNKKIQDIC